MAGENGPARPDIATKPPLPADVRNCNFYVLMEALYRRYGTPGQDISLRTEPARRSCVSALTPVSVFRVRT